jgi:hypothetical protein
MPTLVNGGTDSSAADTPRATTVDELISTAGAWSAGRTRGAGSITALALAIQGWGGAAGGDYGIGAAPWLGVCVPVLVTVTL